MVNERLYTLLNGIITKMTTYKTYINKLCTRFTEKRNIPYNTPTWGTNFKAGSIGLVAWGGVIRHYISATRTSNFSTGNIGNETFCTITFKDDTTEEWTKMGRINVGIGSGSSGGLKGYVMYSSSTDQRYYQVTAVQTADTAAQFHGGIQTINYKSIFED